MQSCSDACLDTEVSLCSLVPRPFPPPVFAYCKRSNTGGGNGLGTRLIIVCWYTSINLRLADLEVLGVWVPDQCCILHVSTYNGYI